MAKGLGGQAEHCPKAPSQRPYYFYYYYYYNYYYYYHFYYYYYYYYCAGFTAKGN